MKLKTAWNKLPAAKRMHHLTVPIVGLTGGIATGKSTVAKLLIDHGLPVINADLLVKSIYAHAETKEWIRLNYPDSMKGNEIDFKSLRENFFTAPAVKDEIEAYIYARMPDAFNLSYKNLGRPSFVIYDVPLLFEKNLDVMVDMKVVVYAPAKIQKARLMDRDGHDEALALTIMSSQMDIEVKKNKADFVIDNSATLTELAEEVNQFLRQAFS